MRNLKLATLIAMAATLNLFSACDGEQTEVPAPQIIVNVPPSPPTPVQVDIHIPEMRTSTEACGGRCGPGTHCENNSCVPEQRNMMPSELTIDLVSATPDRYSPGTRMLVPFVHFRARPGSEPRRLTRMVITVAGPLNGPFWNVRLMRSSGAGTVPVSDSIQAPEMDYRMDFDLNVEIQVIEDFYLVGGVPEFMSLGDYTVTIEFEAEEIGGRAMHIQNNIPPLRYRVDGADPCLWDNRPPAWIEQVSSRMEPSFPASERRIVAMEFQVTACRLHNLAGFDVNLTHQDASVPDTSVETDGTGPINDRGALYRNLSIATSVGTVLFGPTNYAFGASDNGSIRIELRGNPYTMNTGERVRLKLEADVVRGSDDPEWQRSFFYLWQTYTDTGSGVRPFIAGYGNGNQPVRQMIRLVR